MSRRAARWVMGLLAAVVALGALGAFLFVREPIATFQRLGRWTLRSAGLKRREVQGARGDLVWWSGGSGPAVMLLHGSNDLGAGWATVVKPLARGRRLIVPDLPGHGESAPHDGPLPIAEILAGIDRIAQEESPSQPLTLIGNSMGGWLALLYAREHPDRVARVIVENGAPVAAGIAKVNMMPKTREEMRATLNALTGPNAPAFPNYVVDDLLRRTPNGSFARVAQTDLRPYILDGRLAEVRVPVVLVWGDSDDLLPMAYAEALRSGLPQATLEVIAGCGHVSHRECPDPFVAAVEKALAR
jgi:pimeloyl-ACP methyl ester carboxylesterase